MVCIFFSKVSMTLTRCSTGGFGRSWVWWYLFIKVCSFTMKAKAQLLL
jgi:hypothetical protein